ncbi:DUF167 domain-containing protein [bacterium]|nr:DUF167 domain-containing protein [bacterium]
MKIKVRLQPKSSTNRIVGISGEALKIHVNAPPFENKANQACLKILSAFFDVPKSTITLLSGKKSKDKLFDIPFLDEKCFNEKLAELKK